MQTVHSRHDLHVLHWFAQWNPLAHSPVCNLVDSLNISGRIKTTFVVLILTFSIFRAWHSSTGTIFILIYSVVTRALHWLGPGVLSVLCWTSSLLWALPSLRMAGSIWCLQALFCQNQACYNMHGRRHRTYKWWCLILFPFSLWRILTDFILYHHFSHSASNLGRNTEEIHFTTLKDTWAVDVDLEPRDLPLITVVLVHVEWWIGDMPYANCTSTFEI